MGKVIGRPMHVAGICDRVRDTVIQVTLADMGDVIPFGKKPKTKRSILCQNNHHKWEVVNEREFDVKQGKLVTQERCSLCKLVRNKLT